MKEWGIVFERNRLVCSAFFQIQCPCVLLTDSYILIQSSGASIVFIKHAGELAAIHLAGMVPVTIDPADFFHVYPVQKILRVRIQGFQNM